jgi:hypothetical protein
MVSLGIKLFGIDIFGRLEDDGGRDQSSSVNGLMMPLRLAGKAIALTHCYTAQPWNYLRGSVPSKAK